jgi:LysR family glycine cleavage system transcriptional activator
VAGGEADVALRYWTEDEWTGLEWVKLLEVELFPVCSPAYRPSSGGLAKPADLRHATLVRLLHEPWKPWFRAAGLDWPEPASGPLFSDASLMLDAAANGLGVALARNVLVESDLASGRLAHLFKVSLPSSRAYYALCSHSAKARPEVRTFIKWLLVTSKRRPAAAPLHGVA